MQNVRPTPPLVFRMCNKHHFGMCNIGGFRCYQCQGEGHMAKDCPQNKNQMQGKNIGQVYTLDAKKVKGNNTLIVGTCHVNGYPCFVLFTCGVSWIESIFLVCSYGGDYCHG